MAGPASISGFTCADFRIESSRRHNLPAATAMTVQQAVLNGLNPEGV
jgi:hypothetical protein